MSREQFRPQAEAPTFIQRHNMKRLAEDCERLPGQFEPRPGFGNIGHTGRDEAQQACLKPRRDVDVGRRHRAALALQDRAIDEIWQMRPQAGIVGAIAVRLRDMACRPTRSSAFNCPISSRIFWRRSRYFGRG